MYLAIVLDLFNREVVGWSLKPRMSRPGDGCADHGVVPASSACRPDAILDRGSRKYASHDFRASQVRNDLFDEPRGNCWNNAPTSWLATETSGSSAGDSTRTEVRDVSFEYRVFTIGKDSIQLSGLFVAQQVPANWLRQQAKDKLAA